METIFALFLLIVLLAVLSVDASLKRREYLRKQERA